MFILLRRLAASVARARAPHLFGSAMLLVLLAACGGAGGGGGGSSAGSTGSTGGSAPSPLTIVAQPADVSVVAGAPATLDVKASAAASYQWQRSNGTTWDDLAGATQDAYAIAATQVQDDGARFRVVVISSDGKTTLTSSEATLHVGAAPVPAQITLAPADLTLVEGQVGSLSVTATGTSLSYRWQSSSDGATFADVPGAASATLVLAAVALADDGRSFRVIVSNAQGTATSAGAHLTVTPAPIAPTFTTSPVDAAVVAGNSATFTVAVSGVPVPTLSWQSSADGSTWIPLAGEAATRLVLSSVSTSDSGKRFRVQATNPTGTVESAVATLAVTPAPVAAFISAPPASLTVGVGASPVFHVTTGGVPAPTLQWQISIDAGATFANVTGATAADLTLPAVTTGDDGKQLRVLARNASGTATSTAARLTVRPPPHITQQPQAQAWRSGLPLPQFQVAVAGTGITYQWQSSTGGGAWSDIASATTPSLTFTPPAADASVRVVATNAAGDSATSDAAAVTRLHWTYVTTNPGDTVRDLAWLDANTLVAVGDAGTVLRSTDAGLTWQATRETDVAHASGLTGVAFASTSVGVAVGDGGTLLRTTDGGSHWLTVGAGLTSQLLMRVAFSDAQTAVAVGNNGTLLRSTDAGLTWAAVNIGTGDLLEGVAFRNGVGVVASYEGDLFRTINGGAQWSRVFPPTAGAAALGLGDIAFASNSVVMAGGQSGLIRSTDAGVTWQASNPGIYWSTGVLAFHDASTGVALPHDQGGVAFMTSDGGASWSQSANWPGTGAFQPGPITQAGTGVHFGPGGVGIAAGTQGTLWRTVDGGQSWTEVDISGVPSAVPLRGVSFGSANVGVAYGGYSTETLYRTADGGDHWSAVGANLPTTSPSASWVSVQFRDATNVIALDSNGLTARSSDGGATWASGTRLPSGSPTAVLVFANANVGAAAGSFGLLTTSDGGLSWTAHPIAFGIVSMAYVNPTTLVAVDGFGAVQRSTDGGATWQTSFSDGSRDLGGVRIGPAGAGVAFGQFGRLLHTSDGGATWVDLTRSGVDDNFSEGWFVSATEGYLLSDRIYRTTDGGLTWALDQAVRIPQGSSYLSPLRAGVSLDGQSSLVVGAHGVVMRRSP
jgi:photosystem II stability/assembly factor-like uncharacterized protein